MCEVASLKKLEMTNKQLKKREREFFCTLSKASVQYVLVTELVEVSILSLFLNLENNT